MRVDLPRFKVSRVLVGRLGMCGRVEEPDEVVGREWGSVRRWRRRWISPCITSLMSPCIIT